MEHCFCQIPLGKQIFDRKTANKYCEEYADHLRDIVDFCSGHSDFYMGGIHLRDLIPEPLCTGYRELLDTVSCFQAVVC